jgi:hypothetical protein
MNDKHPSSLAIWLVAVALFVSMAGSYAVAYFVASTGTTPNLNSGGTCRVYRQSWVAMLFLPAALIESAATGREVMPAWPAPGP